MLSHQENERITRTGPGTPMGEVMRRYWMPALMANELPDADCNPVRVRLLGEDLIAFRNTEGQVGLVGNHCPHRGASLYFGRNEENGLRCVYHGWKFDVAGNCVDMPNEPPESNFKEKIHHTAYPCVERGGVVWTYMGPPESMPPLAEQEWMRAPEGSSFVSKTFEDCNWLQGLEGGVDTAHSSFLHRNLDGTVGAPGKTGVYRAKATAPKLEVMVTEYGYRYASLRHLREENQTYVRVYQFVMPFHQMRAFEGYLPDMPVIQGHMWVPIDDEHHWVYNWMYARDGRQLPAELIEMEESITGRGPADLIPGTFRLKRNAENDYLIDREAQRTRSYTGIDGVNTQDMAIQETMGAIYDRSSEHLGTSDLAVIAARRLLLEACTDVEEGRDPLGSQAGTYSVRAAEMVIPADQPWYGALKEELAARW